MVLVPRGLMIFFGGYHTGGDSNLYLTVAQNIAENFCVSLSDPGSGACAPHWGGNQLPGYPLLIATVIRITSGSIGSVLVVQSILFSLAVILLLNALRRAGLPSAAVIIVVIFLGLSPSLVGWSRSLLTETISVAVAIWLLAELTTSFSQGQLRVVRVAVIMVVGIFVRYDFALLIVPVAIASLIIHGWADAFRRFVIVSLLCCLPLIGWSARSAALGLLPTPQIGLTPEGGPLPTGTMKWVGTWLVDQYDLRNSVWALVNYDYNDFRPPVTAYDSGRERSLIEAQIRLLETQFMLRPVPIEIDGIFGELALERIAREPLRHWITLPGLRAWWIWAIPAPSMGWPAEIDTQSRESLRNALKESRFSHVAAFILEHPEKAVMKTLVTAHRYGLIIGALTIAVFLVGRLRQRNIGVLEFLAFLALGFALVRTIAFSQTILVETRYLTPALAWLDVAVALYVHTLIWGRNDRVS
jgi:hypothetical protein